MSPDEVIVTENCIDGIQNQNETDIDCGGETCNACADWDNCSINSDNLAWIETPDTIPTPIRIRSDRE